MNSEADFVTSTITVGEYFTGAYRKDRFDYVDAFKSLIFKLEFEVPAIDWSIADKAAQIRRKYTEFKLMDALQFSVALKWGCDLFVTNDRQLKQFENMSVVLVSEFL